MNNFSFCHSVFYPCCLQTLSISKSLKFVVLERINSRISLVVCSFFEFGTVSKWCIREWVKRYEQRRNVGYSHFLHFSHDFQNHFSGAIIYGRGYLVGVTIWSRPKFPYICFNLYFIPGHALDLESNPTSDWLNYLCNLSQTTNFRLFQIVRV